MKYLAEIIFGKDQIQKYHNNETFTDFEKTINIKKFTFETQTERNAFYKGIAEAMGWLEIIVINESEENDYKTKKEEDKFDYWTFIEKYYPNYYNCDDVLLSDILTKKLLEQEIHKDDEEYIKDWNFRNELFKTDKKLLCQAFENYFNIIFPCNLDL